MTEELAILAVMGQRPHAWWTVHSLSCHLGASEAFLEQQGGGKSKSLKRRIRRRREKMSRGAMPALKKSRLDTVGNRPKGSQGSEAGFQLFAS